MTLNEKIKEIISRNLKALENDLYLCEANETGDMWRKYVDYISRELTTLLQQEREEAELGALDRLCEWYIGQGFRENEVKEFKRRYSQYLAEREE